MILNITIKIGALFTALILMLTGCSINNKTLEKSQKNEDVLVTLILVKVALMMVLLMNQLGQVQNELLKN